MLQWSMLSVKGISKKYGEVVALDNVSFNLGDGEVLFITGPSGSGKSTLVKVISTEILPDTGEVLFNDVNIAKLSNKETLSYRKNIGVVYQDFKVVGDKTVRENLEVVLAVKNVPREGWEKLVAEVLNKVMLSGKQNHFPAELSGGELQRVAVARAIIGEPKLVLADEPTGNLDWETGWEVIKLLMEAKPQKTSVVITSHNRDLIKKSKHKVIELKEGKIV